MTSADPGLSVCRLLSLCAAMAVTIRAPFRTPPGLDVPPKLLVHQRISIEDRQAKRLQVLQAFKRESSYADMLWLRSNKDCFLTPAGGDPESPRTEPHISKREWERAFRKFKAECKAWSAFRCEGKALTRTSP